MDGEDASTATTTESETDSSWLTKKPRMCEVDKEEHEVILLYKRSGYKLCSPGHILLLWVSFAI